MADEFGFIMERGDIKFNYELIYKQIELTIEDYNALEYEKIGQLGINPFDLHLLGDFIKKNNIKNVVEFGSGTSSKFLDNLGVNRKSFALDSIYFNDLVFEKINLYESYELVQKYLNENKVDFILIDCEHSESMAKLIFEKFLKIIDFKIPIFIHDWFDFDKQTYKEQIFYYNNLFDYYNLHLMSDIPQNYIEKLKNKNLFLDKLYPVPRCCSILTPKNGK